MSHSKHDAYCPADDEPRSIEAYGYGQMFAANPHAYLILMLPCAEWGEE